MALHIHLEILYNIRGRDEETLFKDTFTSMVVFLSTTFHR